MAITFIPPLGEQAVVVVVPVDLEQQHDIQVYFSAAFDSCDGLTLDDGLRVQIWSNFPAPGRAAGQWGDTTFEAGKAGSDDSVNLCLVPDEHFPTKGNTILHASFVVPASGQSHFAYTYRLVYPSGDIKWLGDYGRNGQLVLQRTSSPSPQRALSLASGWVAQSDRSYRWECTANAKGVKVGDVHSDVDQAIFAFGKDGAQTLGHSRDCFSPSQLAFLVPRINRNSVISLPTSIVYASEDSSILFSAGDLKASGTGVLLLEASNIDKNVQSLMDRILSHSALRLRPVYSKPPSNFVVLASQGHIMPVTVSIIPLSAPAARISTIHIPFVTCKSLILSPPQFSIFSSQTSSGHLFTNLSNDPDHLMFTLPSSGAQFIVSPVYNLPASASGREYHISILTPYTPFSSPPTSVAELPTPPPSPPLRSRTLPTPAAQARSSALIRKRDNAGHPLSGLVPRMLVFLLMMLKDFWTLLIKLMWGLVAPGSEQALQRKTEIWRATDHRPTSSSPHPPRKSVGQTEIDDRLDVCAASVCVDVPDGRRKVSVLISAPVDASVHDVVIEFDGKSVKSTMKDAVVAGKDKYRAWVREFDPGQAGGRVKISLAVEH